MGTGTYSASPRRTWTHRQVAAVPEDKLDHLVGILGLDGINADPEVVDEPVRQLKADLLRQMGYRTTPRQHVYIY